MEVGLWGTTREEAVEVAQARRLEAQSVQVLASGLKRGGRNLHALISGLFFLTSRTMKVRFRKTLIRRGAADVFGSVRLKYTGERGRGKLCRVG